MSPDRAADPLKRQRSQRTRGGSVRLLLEAGAEPNHPTALLEPFYVAVSGQSLEVIELLLAAGANLDGNGSALPLVAAVINSDTALVHLLLDAGAQVDSVSTDGSSALAAAASFGGLEMVELLLVAGADVNLQAPSNGWTAFAQCRTLRLTSDGHGVARRWGVAVDHR